MSTIKSFLSTLICILCQSTLLISKDYSLHNDPFNDVKEQLWLFGHQHTVLASYTWEDAATFIQHDPSAIKGWASDTTKQTFCSLIHSAPWGKIWSLSYFYSLNALFVRDVVIPIFNENDYVLIPFWGRVSPHINKILLQNARFPKNFYFLGNSDACTKTLRSDGLQAFTVSHNAFIDRNLFRPFKTRKKYKAIYLGDCRAQKRVHLASSILSDLLVVTLPQSVKEGDAIAGAKKMIYTPPAKEIPEYINQARCGLILSAFEGGCYASTEYLYCGIPVVSTESIGGRDAYYDEITAVIVDDTVDGVKKGVETICERQIDPWEVRRRALAVSDKMLDTLAYEILLPIFRNHNDSHQANPRGFVDAKINESTFQGSKGRTAFQPENATHNTIEKIQQEQKNI